MQHTVQTPAGAHPGKRLNAVSSPDAEGAKTNHIRVVDESGEDYLFLASCFVDANLSKEALDAITNGCMVKFPEVQIFTTGVEVSTYL